MRREETSSLSSLYRERKERKTGVKKKEREIKAYGYCALREREEEEKKSCFLEKGGRGTKKEWEKEHPNLRFDARSEEGGKKKKGQKKMASEKKKIACAADVLKKERRGKNKNIEFAHAKERGKKKKKEEKRESVGKKGRGGTKLL